MPTHGAAWNKTDTKAPPAMATGADPHVILGAGDIQAWGDVRKGRANGLTLIEWFRKGVILKRVIKPISLVLVQWVGVTLDDPLSSAH